jgi:hypothetical protein
MAEIYDVSCDCGRVKMRLTGAPRVRGHCHCDACRGLLDIPFHSVTAWDADQVNIVQGHAALTSFQHPHLTMKKIFCNECGEVLYNTNKLDWRVVSQHLLKKNIGHLPEELQPLSHFHYASRILDVADSLPKKD